MAKRAEKKTAPVTTLHQVWNKIAVSIPPGDVCVGASGAPLESSCDRTKVMSAQQQSILDSITRLTPADKMHDKLPRAVISRVQQVPLQASDKCVPLIAPQATKPCVPIVAPKTIDKGVPDFSPQTMGKPVPEGDFPLICFDLETTGLSIDDEIVQISACGVIDGVHHDFNRYVLPSKKMAYGASKVTGIRLRRGCMYHNRTKVQTCSILQALNQFIHWLKRFPKSLLVAHNAHFDSRMLIKSCLKYKLMAFGLQKAIVGFVDTIPVVKDVFPGRACYQLESVVQDVLGKRFKAHDAREDTKALLLLLGHKSIDRHILLKHSYSVEQAEKSYFDLDEKKRNMKSLQELVDASALSKGMAEKAAISGLTKADLDSAVKSKGLEGLKEVLQTDVKGKPRVTNRTAIVESLFKYLSLSNP